MILFIEHIDIEGPGTIETYLQENSLFFKTIKLHRGGKFPVNLEGINAVVMMGGPMNVYEEDQFSFLKEEGVFINKILKAEVPFLGICLGSQLLAKAAGAKVVKSPVQEVGWFKAQFNSDGKSDSLFHGLGEEIDVYHWHEDTWEVPRSGKLLATSAGCPNQALKVGRNAYGLQFHVEVTGRIIAEWCKAYWASNDSQKKKKAEDMLKTYAQKKESFNATAWKIYDNFMKIIGTNR